MHRRVPSVLALSLFALPLTAQDLPESGVSGYDFVYATSPGGVSQLFAVNLLFAGQPVAVGAPVAAVPSRWAHRRRTLGALETAIAADPAEVFVTPMGDAAGNGALHLVDLRTPSLFVSALVPTGNPAAYDVGLAPGLNYAFCAEDDGAGNTRLRGFSYATAGQLNPLAPSTLTIPGTPSAYVNRIEVDEAAGLLHVPTSTGIQVVMFASTTPQMTLGPFVSAGTQRVVTNAASFDDNGVKRLIVGTSTFDVSDDLEEAGFLSWTASGTSHTGLFGPVPGAPGKSWIPAAGAEEVAICSNGTDAYVYLLLREPLPGTFFIKPSAIGVVRFINGAAPAFSTILMPMEVGEPFAIPTSNGTRVAFESSFGPPFSNDPPGGGEKVSIVYSPLDSLGAGSLDGVLGVPAPLGGRVSTKGMERPIWSPDGKRVLAATSHFAGAPNPGVPGLEVLNVPASVPLDKFSAPHTTIPNLPFPNQSIIHPGLFDPREPALASSVAGLSFFGNVFHQGAASVLLSPFGELGQLQLDATGFTQSAAVPNFPAVFPPTFDDVVGSTVPVPASFGARRTSFNLHPTFGLFGVTMIAAAYDRILLQPTGWNALATLGQVRPLPTGKLRLPAGWITTTEFYSL